jgi:hypothetical protein
VTILLDNLVKFLRHDFDATDEESLRERNHLDVMWFIDVDEARAKEIQSELIADLAPVVIPKRYRRGRDALESSDSTLNTAAAEELVEKINEMNLAPKWAIQWVNPQSVESRFKIDDKFVKRREKAIREAYANFLKSEGRPYTPKAITEEIKRNPIPMSGRASNIPPILGFYAEALKKYKVERPPKEIYPVPVFPDRGQGIVKVGQQKFYVSKFLYGRSAKERMYGLVIDALERGDFSRLRRCKECDRFFAADDLRQKFCTSDCRDIADRRDAKRRVSEMRKRQRHRLEIPSELASMTLPKSGPPHSFINFFYRVTKGNLAADDERSFAPLVKAVGQGSPLKGWNVITKWKGGKPDEVWVTLPDAVRKVF